MINKQRKFFRKLKSLIHTHPHLAIILIHEYFRNLYIIDPHIPFKEKNSFKRIDRLLVELIALVDSLKKLGSYNINFKHANSLFSIQNKKTDPRKNSSIVYGNLWNQLRKKEIIEAKKLIVNRLSYLKTIKHKKFFKEKRVLDSGCGSGRYSNAILSLGAKEVHAVDYGKTGLKFAKKNFNNKKLFFKQADVLKLPFKNESFDIVFSNGVLHHTTNMAKGIRELVRVCKKGGNIWLYLYGSGGLFWEARKEMNRFMKLIPRKYAEEILKLIGLPNNRWIFMDTWYVPIEKHSTHKEVYSILKKENVKIIEKMKKGNNFDLETSINKTKNGSKIWGEGDIRLMITK